MELNYTYGMKHKWSKIIKEKAELLRKKGYSYNQLSKKLKVPKSTLHEWIRGVQRPVKFSRLDRIRWIKEIQPLGAQGNKRKRECEIHASSGFASFERGYNQKVQERQWP